MMALKAIPVIDISPFKNSDVVARKQVVEKVAQACVEIGFLIVSGHGIPSSTIENIVTTSKTFFTLDPKEKGTVARPRPEIIRGYGGMESEGLAYSQDEETPPDLKEVISTSAQWMFPTRSTTEALPRAYTSPTISGPSSLPSCEASIRITFIGWKVWRSM
jgi:isopenicillin N synthase-like dioxygenase